MLADWGERERPLTDRVSVLLGANSGRFPSCNTLLVRGSSETALIDPSIDVVENGGVPAPVDAIFNSHAHEDHVAGNGMFENARVHIHEDDRVNLESIDEFVSAYGYGDQYREGMEKFFIEKFYFAPRPDAKGFCGGDVFELGEAEIEAVHLPGHTSGHSGFRVSEGVFYLSDIDLTGFGPIYVDRGSSIDDFEESLLLVREEDADYYVTSHHRGVIESRSKFREHVDAYLNVIHRRHDEMLAFLDQPRTLDDIVSHRFVFRPDDTSGGVHIIELRTAEQHLGRMLRRGEARENEPGVFERI